MKNKNNKIKLFLTDRDMEILAFLVHYHLTGQMVFEVSQVFKQPFTSVANARARLSQLFRSGFLKRGVQFKENRGGNQYYYFLTKLSASLFPDISELLEQYLEEHSYPNKAPKSHRDDTSFCKRLRKHFGKMNLAQVRPRDIATYIKKRRQDGVKDITINHELRLLRHAYNLAIKLWELVDETPFAKIKIPSGEVKRVRYLSENEERRLFQVLPDWLRPIVVIARETGLRRANIANLRWSQVNLFNKGIVIENTKNGEPIGLPMTDGVYYELKRLNKVRRLDSDYIFNKDGIALSGDWISKSFMRICQKANVENFRFHDLRHDFCSRLVQRGVDLYTVAALAGHKDVKMTQRYAHLSPERLRGAINVLNPDYNLTTVRVLNKN